MSTVGTPLRWMRAVVLAGVAGFVGLSGHVFAGGLLPAASHICLFYLLGVFACAALLGGPASTARILALTVGGQFATHLGLSISGGHIGQPPVGFGGLGPDAVVVEFRNLALDALGEHGLMTFVHLLASVLVGLWLAVGEQTLWAFLSLIAHSLYVLVGRPWYDAVHPPLLPLVANDSVPSATQLDLFDGSISRRGPPSYALAA